MARHVLLAEADAPTRTLLATVLERAGHEVTTAEDCDTALRVLTRDQPPLVLLADVLPGATSRGLEVCRAVRAAERAGTETFVVVLTNAHDRAAVAAALDAGADDVLLTSPPPDVLDAYATARVRVAERRIAEDVSRRRAESALARAQRFVGLGETSVALQHEINNPLAALLGHAALLQHGLHDPGEERALLAVIVEQAQRIADVVRRISALRNPDGVEYERDA